MDSPTDFRELANLLPFDSLISSLPWTSKFNWDLSTDAVMNLGLYLFTFSSFFSSINLTSIPYICPIFLATFFFITNFWAIQSNPGIMPTNPPAILFDKTTLWACALNFSAFFRILSSLIVSFEFL